MNESEERKAFEAWAAKIDPRYEFGRYCLIDEPDGYVNQDLDFMWNAWIARASIAAKQNDSGKSAEPVGIAVDGKYSQTLVDWIGDPPAAGTPLYATPPLPAAPTEDAKQLIGWISKRSMARLCDATEAQIWIRAVQSDVESIPVYAALSASAEGEK